MAMVEVEGEGEGGSRDTRGKLGSEQGRGTGCITSCYLLLYATSCSYLLIICQCQLVILGQG